MMEVRQHGVSVTTVAPGSVATSFPIASSPAASPIGGTGHAGAGWMLTADDVAQTVLDVLRARDGALLSRIDMRPLRPQSRQR
jgi:short-subunit dehydrogenase